MYLYLLNILTNEYKVDTAEAQLSDAEEHVRDLPGQVGHLADGGGWGGEEAGVGDVTVGQIGGPRPPAQLLGVVHQEVHAVNTDDAHEDQTDVANNNAAVFYRIWHCQDTSPNVAFEKMNDDICVWDFGSLRLYDWCLLTRRRIPAI